MFAEALLGLQVEMQGRPRSKRELNNLSAERPLKRAEHSDGAAGRPEIIEVTTVRMRRAFNLPSCHGW